MLEKLWVLPDPAKLAFLMAGWISVSLGQPQISPAFADVAANTGANASSQKETVEKIPFEQYLLKSGIRLDCYFTLETRRSATREVSAFANALISNEQTAPDIEAFCTQLRQKVKGIAVIRRKENPAVVHIVDNALATDKAYVMGKAIDITYSGTPQGLVESLGAKLENKVGPRMGGSMTQAFDDNVTQIFTLAKQSSLRAILTDSLPLSSYYRILWTSETGPDAGKTVTWVQYYGPARQNALQWMADEKVTPFTKGEVAYAANPVTQNTAGAAIQFIEDQSRAEDPRQLRWSLLYLGKTKSVANIPVLIKHLDYRYAPVPVPEEAFPAVRALSMIGIPAAQSALQALKTEENDLRLQLLCRVVFNVHGAENGKASIDKAAVGASAAQAQKIKAAWAVSAK